jgi:hypothetical protein
MRRWLFCAVAAVSLLMAIASAALWGRSHFRFEGFSSATASDPSLGQRGREAYSYHGTLELYLWKRDKWPGSILQPGRWDFGSDPLGPPGGRITYLRQQGMKSVLGLGFLRRDETFTVTGPGPIPPTRHSVNLIVPWWALTLAFLATPAVMWWRRRRAPVPGACRNCGYDLRGTPGSACPECGAAREPAESKA